MADDTIVSGNGLQVLDALTRLRRYEGKRASLDVSMNADDRLFVYLNALEPKHQPKIRQEDVEALAELGFTQGEEGGYIVFLLPLPV